MTQQDKDLLLRDLSARLPYGVKCGILTHPSCRLPNWKKENDLWYKGRPQWYKVNIAQLAVNPIDCFYPYLRPISSLTQEERNKFCDIGGVISHRPDGKLYLVAYFPEALDYLNSIHADYRGMIEKGLAIEVTPENNPYK